MPVMKAACARSAAPHDDLLAAMVLEATARKPGNVHPGASFDDMDWSDFMLSAIVAAPVLADAARQGVGLSIRQAACATMSAVGVNTNLGLLILLAPLAACQDVTQVGVVLESLSADDAAHLYDAIAMVQPGGLGRVEQGDVNAPHTLPVLEAMSLAASRDLVAAQYVNGFAQVHALADVIARQARHAPLDDAIVASHLWQMASHPDTLIARKAGLPVARQAQRKAADALAALQRGDAQADRQIARLDAWLRADGHRRNPGTSADLIAAALYVALRQRWIMPPTSWRENLWP